MIRQLWCAHGECDEGRGVSEQGAYALDGLSSAVFLRDKVRFLVREQVLIIIIYIYIYSYVYLPLGGLYV